MPNFDDFPKDKNLHSGIPVATLVYQRFFLFAPVSSREYQTCRQWCTRVTSPMLQVVVETHSGYVTFAVKPKEIEQLDLIWDIKSKQI